MYSSATTIFTLALAASSNTFARSLDQRQTSLCMLNTVIDPDVSQISNSITQWNADVNAVNLFLNTALSLPLGSLAAAAQNALNMAQDEPCQLKTLASVTYVQGVPAFDCAVTDLGNIFQIRVLDNLSKIIATPTDTAIVHAAVDDINLIRCCNVLPDASILWRDTAEDSGIANTVQTTANREDACATIDCSAQTPVCQSLDNGSFGK